MSQLPEWCLCICETSEQALSDPDHVDRAVENIFATLFAESRERQDRRNALIEESIGLEEAEIQHSPSWLPQGIRGVVRWVEGEFLKSAAEFSDVRATLGGEGCCDIAAHRCLVVHTLAWEAACATRTDRLDVAQTLLQQAEQLLADEPWPNCRGWIAAEKGRLAFWLDEVIIAKVHYAQSLEAFHQADNHFGQANTAEGLARVLIHQGNYLEALQQLMRSERWREPDDQIGRVKRLFHNGRICRYRGELDEAIEYLTEALATLLNHVDNQRWEANVRDVLGDLYLLKGDLRKARREYRASVFEGDDPVVKARRAYRQAKLDLEESQRSPHSAQRRRAIKEIIRRCDDLVAGSPSQNLPEKAQRLQGAAYLALEEWEHAASTLEKAADQFAQGRANWYIADCLHRAAIARLAMGDLATAFGDFEKALHLAVDETQRTALLDSLQQRFAALDPALVCQLLSKLPGEGDDLRCLRDNLLASSAAHRELLRSVASPLPLLAGLRHFKAALQAIESSGDLVQAKEEIQSANERTEHALTIVRAVMNAPEAVDSAWTWWDVTRLKAELPLFESVETNHDWDSQWGLSCQQPALAESINTLADFVAEHGTIEGVSLSVEAESRSLRGCITVAGDRKFATQGMFREPPSMGEFAQWKLSPEQWVRLVVAARQVRAVGGAVSFETIASPDTTVSKYRFCLRIELPLEHRLVETPEPKP